MRAVHMVCEGTKAAPPCAHQPKLVVLCPKALGFKFLSWKASSRAKAWWLGHVCNGRRCSVLLSLINLGSGKDGPS